jgi:heme exporter protein D
MPPRLAIVAINIPTRPSSVHPFPHRERGLLEGYKDRLERDARQPEAKQRNTLLTEIVASGWRAGGGRWEGGGEQDSVFKQDAITGDPARTSSKLVVARYIRARPIGPTSRKEGPRACAFAIME